MTVKELSSVIGATILNPQVDCEREVRYGYACDLLSWVMTHGAEGTAWVTVMTHMNAVAVATLLEFSCMIVPEGLQVDAAVTAKATEEGIPMLCTAKTAFEISGLLYAEGVRATERE